MVGEAQDRIGPPSRRHVNLDPGSFDLNRTVAVRFRMVTFEIVVAGGVASTVQVRRSEEHTSELQSR